MKPILFASIMGSLLVACSSSDDTDDGARRGELEAPARGFQLRAKGTIIEGGQDIEYCEVVQLPGNPSDVYYTNHFEATLTKFSHHLNVYAVDPNHPVNEEIEVGDLHECLQPTLGYKTAGTFGEGFAYIAGSSRPYTRGRLPEGVGKKLYGGQKIIFNYHYLNTSPDPVQAGSILNIHTIEADSIVHRSQLFALLNQTIDIPARNSASFTMECTMRQDVVVYGLSRHTHRWGKDFEAWYVGGERDGQHLFTSRDWETDIGFAPDPPLTVRAGEGFRFRCDFDNTTDAPLKWGDKATEEMCILYGSWYVANPGEAPAAQSCIALPGVSRPAADGVMRGFPMGWPAPDLG